MNAQQKQELIQALENSVNNKSVLESGTLR